MADLTLDNEPLNSSSFSLSAAHYNGRRLHQCLADILTDMSSAHSMLPYFIQYMDACDAMHLVEFWLAVESFRSGQDRGMTSLLNTHRHRHHNSPPSLSSSLSRSLSSGKDATLSPLKDGYSKSDSHKFLGQTTAAVADGGGSTCLSVAEVVDARRGYPKEVESGVFVDESFKNAGKVVLLDRPTRTEAEDKEEQDGEWHNSHARQLVEV